MARELPDKASELTLLNSSSSAAALDETTSPHGETARNDQSAEEDGRAAGARWRYSPCSSACDWKKISVTAFLWWSYFLINGAHSMIAPFFPNEVAMSTAACYAV